MSFVCAHCGFIKDDEEMSEEYPDICIDCEDEMDEEMLLALGII